MKEKQEIKDVALALAQAGFDKKGTDIAIFGFGRFIQFSGLFRIGECVQRKTGTEYCR